MLLTPVCITVATNVPCITTLYGHTVATFICLHGLYSSFSWVCTDAGMKVVYYGRCISLGLVGGFWK